MSPLSHTDRKRLRSLHTGKGRKKDGQFLAEGVRLLEESVRHGNLPLKAYYSESLIGERGKVLVNRLIKLGVPVQKTASRDIDRISETGSSQGLVALFKIPETNLAGCVGDLPQTIMYLDNIADPGNAGTLIRSALAFGLDRVVFSPDSVEPYNGKVVRSSAGAIFGIPPIVGPIAELYKCIDKETCTFIAADLEGESPESVIDNLELAGTVVVTIGSEGAGLSDEVKRLIDKRIRIGHEPNVESLNAAVAGSIIMRALYERKAGK